MPMFSWPKIRPAWAAVRPWYMWRSEPQIAVGERRGKVNERLRGVDDLVGLRGERLRTSCCDFDDHIVGMLEFGKRYFLDADFEGALVVDGLHGRLSC